MGVWYEVNGDALIEIRKGKQYDFVVLSYNAPGSATKWDLLTSDVIFTREKECYQKWTR